MKPLFTVLLLLSAMALCANPIPYQLFSEFWFDLEGDMYIELSCNDFSPLFDATLHFSDGTTQLEYPEPLSIPARPAGIAINLSQALPGLELERWSGQLTIEYEYQEGNLMAVGNVSWGSGLTPVGNTSYVAVYDTSGPWMDEYYVWTMEAPPTPGTDSYQTLARGTLNVSCSDQNGNPVLNARVLVGSHYSQSGYTDVAGCFSTSCICHPINILVKHPQTNETVYEEVHYFSPGGTQDISVNMTLTAIDDPTVPSVPIRGLEAFPNPFIARYHERISLTFDGSKEVLEGAEILVYNLRGQEVAVIPMHSQDNNYWIPDNKLPSGSYLLKLVKAGKDYDQQTLRLIK
ncbi:MAG: T9SS type A sorting domain-containing protein [Candidatus Cloacimonetes bacterium]|nr:T9SS type A sorting domain-containing protein [Candidatus Cloacimonadota bacterium]